MLTNLIEAFSNPQFVKGFLVALWPVYLFLIAGVICTYYETKHHK